MGMVGNARDAQFIRDWCLNDRERDVYGYVLNEQGAPEGWTHLGSGCYRDVYASPDGVAYKVEQYYSDRGEYDGHQSNKSEADNLKRLYLTCRMPEGTRLPRFTFYALDGRGVMAMELLTGGTLNRFNRFDGEGERYWKLRSKLLNALGIEDLHGGNVMVDAETKEVVPVDLGW